MQSGIREGKIYSYKMVSLLRFVASLGLILTATSCYAPDKYPPTAPQEAGVNASREVTQLSEPAIPTPLGTDTINSLQAPSVVSSTPPFRRTLYQINTRLDYTGHTLSTSEEIDYTNQTGEQLNSLFLVIQANQTPDVFNLLNISLANRTTPVVYQFIGHNIKIELPALLQPGSQISLVVEYDLSLSAKLAFPGYTQKQTNLGDWYPFIPPYSQSGEWINHDPADVGENLVYDLADFKVHLVVENASSKVLVASSASATTLSEKTNEFTLDVDNARNVSLSVSDNYREITESVDHIELHAYVFPEHLQAGLASLDTIKQAVAFYDSSFGMYKNTVLTVVESQVPDGMEYDGLFFLGQEYFENYDGTMRCLLVTLSAHETAHQWWYASVANDQATEPWLDEALSTYTELLYYQKYYPDDVNWWWDQRINKFYPDGMVNSSIYDFKSFRPYVNAVYLRGALFLDHIRKIIGDTAFFKFINDYAHIYSLKIVSSTDFFNLLESETHVDITYLKQSFFK